MRKDDLKQSLFLAYVQELLDNSSKLSCIITSLQLKLKLEPIHQEKLHLNTFGSDTFATKACDVVHLSMQGPGRWK